MIRANHIKANVISFLWSKGSSYIKIPNKNEILGPIYCKKPSFTSEILVAAALNHKSGSTVINPALINSKEIESKEKLKLFCEVKNR